MEFNVISDCLAITSKQEFGDFGEPHIIEVTDVHYVFAEVDEEGNALFV